MHHDGNAEDIIYYSSCKEAFDDGQVCSGVYNIKPDNLPSFEVSNINQQELALWSTYPVRFAVH